MRVFIGTSLLFLAGCGLYMGSEGVKYLGDDMIGFRTQETERQVEEARVEAYEEGKAEANQEGSSVSEAKPIKDGSLTILTGEEVSEATGGIVEKLLPFAGPAGGVLLIIIGLLKGRKEEE